MCKILCLFNLKYAETNKIIIYLLNKRKTKVHFFLFHIPLLFRNNNFKKLKTINEEGRKEKVRNLDF